MAEGWRTNTVITYKSYLIYNTTPGEIFIHDQTWISWLNLIRQFITLDIEIIQPTNRTLKCKLQGIFRQMGDFRVTKNGEFQSKMRQWRPDVLKSLFFELDLIRFWFIDAESLFLIVPNLEFQFPLWPKNILNFSWFFEHLKFWWKFYFFLKNVAKTRFFGRGSQYCVVFLSVFLLYNISLALFQYWFYVKFRFWGLFENLPVLKIVSFCWV